MALKIDLDQATIPELYAYEIALLNVVVNLQSEISDIREKRKQLGLKGREWAISKEAGFTGKLMGKRVINTLDKLFNTWSPREKFELINANKFVEDAIEHELIY